MVGAAVLAVFGCLMSMPSCSDDESEDSSTDPGSACPEGGGPVAGPADAHCIEDDGTPIVQSVGECATDVDEAASSASDEEEYFISYGGESDDDDCKYRVSITNSCIAVGRPVTFTLTLNRKLDGTPASGATPAYPEFFMEDGHVSRSNRISAPETSRGTYSIGPIVFDRPGRWVARFHFFERCSDVPEDSPHGHASYYIDVP